MTIQEHISAGDLGAALSLAQNAVRKDPADAKGRILLFQLQCVLGNWEKARTQLRVLDQMDAGSMMLAHIFQPVIECEALRKDIFLGKRTPIIFGEPEEWMGWLVQANQLASDESSPGNTLAAAELRGKALEAAEPVSGRVNEQPFSWIADADSRLGPMLEVVMDGCYRWVPFSRIAKIHLEPPHDLRDLVWITAQFTWVNGGENSGLIPTRYPGSEEQSDSGFQLSRRTEWVEKAPDLFVGLGQRILSTDDAEYPLLEVRDIHFDFVSAASEAGHV